MKKTITFEFTENDSFDEAEIRRTINATGAYSALHEVGEKIFRPARKHGYDDSELNKLIEQTGETPDGFGIGEEIISILEKRFYEILEENGVNLEDLL